MSKVTPWLWFDLEAEEAAEFYTSIFPNSRVLSVSHYGEAGPRPAGTVMTVEFELDGQRLVGLKGGGEVPVPQGVFLQDEAAAEGGGQGRTGPARGGGGGGPR